MDLKLNGKKALVMGSSEGIGRAIAKTLVDEGAKVALSARNEEKLQMAQKETGAETYFSCDYSKKGATKKLVQGAIDHFDGLDILVTNAGGPNKGAYLDISTEQWEQDYQSLWLSVVEATHACLPVMKTKNYGRILMVTSIAAREPLKGLTTSNGLRAGLEGLGKSMAHEYAPYGITVNQILPGYTNTDRLRDLNLSKEWISQTVPAGRLAEPEEVGDAAAFLASPRAGYITGQSLAIEGGVLRAH